MELLGLSYLASLADWSMWVFLKTVYSRFCECFCEEEGGGGGGGGRREEVMSRTLQTITVYF